MTLEYKILTVATIAAVLAVPVAQAARHSTDLLKVEKAEAKTLHIQLDSKDQELQRKNSQIEKLQQLNQQQQQQINDEQQQLQAKAAAKARYAAYTTPNCAAYQSLVAQYDWDVSTAMAIMRAESGCRAITPDNANINYDHISDYGLFQLHGINVTDPAENVRIAYSVKYLGAGRSFRPWNTYTSGAYLRYL